MSDAEVHDAYEAVMRHISSLDAEGRADLIEMLRGTIFGSMAIADGRGPSCPKCGSSDLVRNGLTTKGTQRYFCKSCGATRCAGTGLIMLNSKLPAEKWEAYVPMFVDHISCSKVAMRLDIQMRTAWFMRIRVLEALFKNLPAFQAISGCRVEVDEIFFRESFKGTRFEDMENPPREPRHDCI